jgi:hypothetical protein
VSLCLAEEYEAGVSAPALARKYKMHKSTVWRHLARAGVVTGQYFLANNEQLTEEIRALRAAGLALRQIAARGNFPPFGAALARPLSRKRTFAG